MRTREGAAPLLALALACSCATNPTPDDRRVSQEEAISSGKGAYAFVRGDGAAEVAGELIASGNGRLSVLTDHGGLVDVDFARVADLTLGVHDNDFGGIAAWTVLGSLSTISHGVFLIFSLPVWLASGIGAAANESHRGLFVCRPNTRSDPPMALSMTSVLDRRGRVRALPPGSPPWRRRRAAPRTCARRAGRHTVGAARVDDRRRRRSKRRASGRRRRPTRRAACSPCRALRPAAVIG